MTTAHRLIFVVSSAASLLACGAPAKVAQAPVPPDVVTLLARCERLEDPDLRSWHCGGLTAVETVVSSASERELALAFEHFAARFGGDRPRRVDSAYVRGEARHTAIRLEGEGPRGEQVEAQMVAVVEGDGVRLVTCSTRDAAAACAPVVAHLVEHTP